MIYNEFNQPIKIQMPKWHLESNTRYTGHVNISMFKPLDRMDATVRNYKEGRNIYPIEEIIIVKYFAKKAKRVQNFFHCFGKER